MSLKKNLTFVMLATMLVSSVASAQYPDRPGYGGNRGRYGERQRRADHGRWGQNPANFATIRELKNALIEFADDVQDAKDDAEAQLRYDSTFSRFRDNEAMNTYLAIGALAGQADSAVKAVLIIDAGTSTNRELKADVSVMADSMLVTLRTIRFGMSPWFRINLMNLEDQLRDIKEMAGQFYRGRPVIVTPPAPRYETIEVAKARITVFVTGRATFKLTEQGATLESAGYMPSKKGKRLPPGTAEAGVTRNDVLPNLSRAPRGEISVRAYKVMGPDQIRVTNTRPFNQGREVFIDLEGEQAKDEVVPHTVILEVSYTQTREIGGGRDRR